MFLVSESQVQLFIINSQLMLFFFSRSQEIFISVSLKNYRVLHSACFLITVET